MDRGMQQEKEVQHVYLVGAKSLGAYGGYETFVYKLTEYHQNKQNIKYHVACKANGDGCMDENKFEGVTKINDHEFELHNAHCFKIDVPQIGPAQAIYYDVAALKACCEHIKKNHIPHGYIGKIFAHEGIVIVLLAFMNNIGLSNAIINRTYFIGCLLIFLFIVLGTAILINKIIEQCPVKVSEMLTGGRSGATHNKRSFVKNIKNR